MEGKRRVLIIQEDKKLSDILFNYLSTTFLVTTTNRINKAEELIFTSHFDLIVLDTKNYNGNCIDFCKKIKKETKSKVIFLSSCSDIKTKEICFQNGGDDFLMKPFIPKELVLRINSLLGEYKLNSKLEYRGIQLDKDNQILSINNCAVPLSPTEYLVVEYMLGGNNEIYKTEKLTMYLSSVKNKNISESALTVLIKRLRGKLNKGTGMELIKTRYGKGYYLGI